MADTAHYGAADIRLDRRSWDGRLQVEWITAKGRDAFATYGRFYKFVCANYEGPPSLATWTPQLHDLCLREFIEREGLIVEPGDENA